MKDLTINNHVQYNQDTTFVPKKGNGCVNVYVNTLKTMTNSIKRTINTPDIDGALGSKGPGRYVQVNSRIKKAAQAHGLTNHQVQEIQIIIANALADVLEDAFTQREIKDRSYDAVKEAVNHLLTNIKSSVGEALQ
jgi:hypothetical protein